MTAVRPETLLAQMQRIRMYAPVQIVRNSRFFAASKWVPKWICKKKKKINSF
jgi:hypothetical protein